MDASPHVVGRVGALLRSVAHHEPSGAGTTTVAQHAGLPRATAHRLLDALRTEGLVDRSPDNGHWVLGPELFFWGSAAADRYDVTGLALPAVRRLAEETQESAFFSARRGDETICLLREDGSFPIRSFVLYEGVRFPLGVASAGLVILAHLPEADTDDYLRRSDLVPDWGAAHTPEALHRRIRATRETGYAVNPGLIVEGSWGMGAAVFNSLGEPAWALSLTGIESRFTATRQRQLGALLLREAHRLTRQIAVSDSARRRTL
ncbi:IclR family transcriptional regulator [Nocardioides sp.]|uniref:IclR family transcriptional regulator n=1 Tax=Nocardioides sp. TaxID=35761 RepID=UPI002736EA6F|nr:IclR family transcriptional regulator [Nocardioides sp.]MDP3890300.1 IclR family transcriptional regulator [Nocardioides sp.]